MSFFKKINLEFAQRFFLMLFLFFLPWQTVWIYKENFLNGFKWEYGTLSFYGTEILLWFMVGIFILQYFKKLKNQKEKFKLTKDHIFVFCILLFVVYVFLSIFWSIDKNVASQQALRIMEMILLFFILAFGNLNFKEIVYSFSTGSIIPSILGIYQFLYQTTFANKWLGLSAHPVWQAGTSIIQSNEIGRWLRAYGTFQHPNIFGGYLVLGIFLILLFLKFKKPSRFIHLLYLLILILQSTALFFTFSRSAWIACLSFLFFYCVILFKEKKKLFYYFPIGIILIVAIIFSIIFYPLLKTRTSIESNHEISSVSERITGYDEAFYLIKNNLWFGVGAGNYTMAIYKNNPIYPAYVYEPVHNVFLLFFAEFGIIGFLFIILLFYHFIIIFIIPCKKRSILALAMFLCFGFLLLFDHYLLSVYSGMTFLAVYFGVSICLKRELSTNHPLLIHNP